MLICQSLLSSIPLTFFVFIPLIFWCCLKFIYFILFNTGIVQHRLHALVWNRHVYTSESLKYPLLGGRQYQAQQEHSVLTHHLKEAWNKSNVAEVKPKHLHLPLAVSCRIGPKLFFFHVIKMLLGPKNPTVNFKLFLFSEMRSHILQRHGQQVIYKVFKIFHLVFINQIISSYSGSKLRHMCQKAVLTSWVFWLHFHTTGESEETSSICIYSHTTYANLHWYFLVQSVRKPAIV